MLLPNLTGYFLRFLYPTWERINWTPTHSYVVNNIVMKSLVIYGSQGSGKTETVRRLSEEAVKFYGRENVNVMMTDSNEPTFILDEALQTEHPIQIMICDDATLTDAPKEDLRAFFRVRNVWYEKTGRTNGYILVIFNTHRFHGILPEFRTNTDSIIWKSLPANPYDLGVVRKFIKEEGVEDLTVIEEKKEENPYWNSVSVFSNKFRRGILILPIADHNFVQKVVKEGYITLQDIRKARRGLD